MTSKAGPWATALVAAMFTVPAGAAEFVLSLGADDVFVKFLDGIYRRLAPWPKHPKADEAAQETFKKASPRR